MGGWVDGWMRVGGVRTNPWSDHEVNRPPAAIFEAVYTYISILPPFYENMHQDLHEVVEILE